MQCPFVNTYRMLTESINALSITSSLVLNGFENVKHFPKDQIVAPFLTFSFAIQVIQSKLTLCPGIHMDSIWHRSIV